jgi:hypothetical protein
VIRESLYRRRRKTIEKRSSLTHLRTAIDHNLPIQPHFSFFYFLFASFSLFFSVLPAPSTSLSFLPRLLRVLRQIFPSPFPLLVFRFLPGYLLFAVFASLYWIVGRPVYLRSIFFMFSFSTSVFWRGWLSWAGTRIFS